MRRLRTDSTAAHRYLLALLLCAIATPRWAQAVEPARTPAQLLPAQGLNLYLEYDGVDAHADAWKATAASAILEGTPAGTILAQSFQPAFDEILKADSASTWRSADYVAFPRDVIHRGFAFAKYSAAGKSHTVFVFPGLGQPERRKHFDRLLQKMLLDKETDPLPAPAQTRGRAMHRFQKRRSQPYLPVDDLPPRGRTWWLEGDSLILVEGPDPDASEAYPRFSPRPAEAKQTDYLALHEKVITAVLDAIEGKAANASTHPGVVAARAEGSDIEGFAPNGLLFAESAKDLGLIDAARAEFGMSGQLVGGTADELDLADVAGFGPAQRVVGRWGFRGKALMSDLRFDARAPWNGLVGTLDPAGFANDRVPPIPRNSGTFGVAALARGIDANSLARLRLMLKDDYVAYFQAYDALRENAKNRRLLDDLFAALGPTWCLYAAPGQRGHGQAEPAFLIEMRNPADVEKRLDAAAAQLNGYLREQEREPGKDAPADGIPPALVLERLPAPARGYRLVSPGGRVPGLRDGLEPTFALGASHLVVATTPAIARAALAAEARAEERWEAAGEAKNLLACLPKNLSFLSVGDPRDSCWPEAIVNMPVMASVWLGLLSNRYVDVPKSLVTTEPPAASRLLSLLGAAPAVSPVARTRDGQTLRASDIRKLLFPSILAATVTDKSLRILRLEALPFGCLWFDMSLEAKKPGKKLTIDMKFGPRG